MTETSSVNIRYRPVRIGWAIKSGDWEALRRAAQYSYALWGGRYNPIIQVDKPGAQDLLDAFNVDALMPVGDHNEVHEFIANLSYLSNTFLQESVFDRGTPGYQQPATRVLDISNAIQHSYDSPQFKELQDGGMSIVTWDKDDPLADIFLMQYGAYPSPDEVGTNYLQMVYDATAASMMIIEKGEVLTYAAARVKSIPLLSRLNLSSAPSRRGMSRYSGGFYLGDHGDFDDVVSFWNVRALQIPLLFVDNGSLARYRHVIAEWQKYMGEVNAKYREELRRVEVWTRTQDPAAVTAALPGMRLTYRKLGPAQWDISMPAPMIVMGKRRAMGLITGTDKKPAVTFTLDDKPFAVEDAGHFEQHAAISVSFIGGLYGNESVTFKPPYVPELNEFLEGKMHFDFDKLRVEPESMGVIIDVHEDECTIQALNTSELVVELFKSVGYKASPSSAGLIAKQLITNLGRLHGARVFKIPGVRKLLSTHGPNASFGRSGALNIIGSKGIGGRPNLTFKDFEDMYIEPRSVKEKLTPGAVFGYLVERGLFRVGADLLCPNCQLRAWYTLERLHDKLGCEMCGHPFDPARQLVDADSHAYRRSGILGAERNAQGAIPVLLTLQFLQEEFRAAMSDGHYTLSLNLSRGTSEDQHACETDFVWVQKKSPDRTGRTCIALAECKDQLPISAEDVENLKKVAMAFPARRFDTYVILSKVAEFTQEEIDLAKSLNSDGAHRAILLWGRELELHHMVLSRAQKGEDMVVGWSLPELAARTADLYFNPKVVPQAEAAPAPVA